MQTIRMWAIGLCLASLGGMILRHIAPEKGSGTVFRVMLSAFFICVFLTPFFSLLTVPPDVFSDSFPTELQQPLLDEAIDRQLSNAVETAVKEATEATLSSRHLSAEKIEVETDFAEDGSIYIRQVTVTLSKESRGHRTEAKQVLEARLETNVNVEESP